MNPMGNKIHKARSMEVRLAGFPAAYHLWTQAWTRRSHNKRLKTTVQGLASHGASMLLGCSSGENFITQEA